MPHLVFLANCNNLWKFAQFSFHAVYTLDNNHYFFPWSMCSRLSFSNIFSQNTFQVGWSCISLKTKRIKDVTTEKITCIQLFDGISKLGFFYNI